MSIFKSLAKSHSLFSHLAKGPSLYIEVYFNRLAKSLSIFPSPPSSLFSPLLPPGAIPITTELPETLGRDQGGDGAGAVLHRRRATVRRAVARPCRRTSGGSSAPPLPSPLEGAQSGGRELGGGRGDAVLKGPAEGVGGSLTMASLQQVGVGAEGQEVG